MPVPKLSRKVDDLDDSLGFMMNLLEVREKESCIDMEIEPAMEMYKMLDDYLPSGCMGDADLVSVADDIEEITDGADKQLKLEQQLPHDIKEQWVRQEFSFQQWKDRGIYILKATPLVMEELEEAQMDLQTMLKYAPCCALS
mmetsp:Transcript_23724/g.52535  ORF Transcript_23724/g.52535 Transcript_23724/m.52535 type:complete len:142 (+) Transcript_23724:75-500(+)